MNPKWLKGGLDESRGCEIGIYIPYIPFFVVKAKLKCNEHLYHGQAY